MVDYSWEEIEFMGVKDMNERLAGKVIIVTGAESGIGRSIVQRCIIDGACVTAAGLNVEGLKETADLCAETGGKERLIWTKTDVRETASVNDMINQTKKNFNRLDAAIANAGIVLGQTPFYNITLDDWDRIIATNLRGVFITIQAACKVLIEQGEGGSLLATGSSTAIRVAPGFASYIAAKGGVHLMMQALALELAEHKIRVNTIVPGTTRTAITEALPGYLDKVAPTLPMGEVVEPYELANFVSFALSDEAPHLTGTLLKVDAGRVVA